MSVIKWVVLTIVLVPRKILGVFVYWLVVPFRKYARNAVYNYVLENGVFLKRLYERKPKKSADGTKWVLDGRYHCGKFGYVKVRKVTILEYWFALCLWVWVDDDSNHDTFDAGHNETMISGERADETSEWVKRKLKADNEYAKTKGFGNTFDLGDEREECFRFWSAMLWNNRNSAYNFQYMFHTQNKPGFYVQIGKLEFGWKDKKDGSYDYIVGVNY